ncbi:hypothetical protein [Actinoplanes auranticolor]|uniref:Uncharacterized protein n=1 Tax=Actinoplanes auranticolor TaxID=47988 RepID=A0A919SGS2_9ACTN|nr:hypothetical protein [Actinoplanes auranticolor]GIM72127.1 hypothetical protein Aau02nite_49340 [Actinoplanes auranticolor]
MTPHLLHPRDPHQSVCGIPADQGRRWATDDPPHGNACEACRTQYEQAARPDDAHHPIGDATLIDTLRRIVAERQYAKIDGVLVDVWSASVTVVIWDNLRDDKRQHLLRLPSHELILRCIRVYAALTAQRGGR